MKPKPPSVACARQGFTKPSPTLSTANITRQDVRGLFNRRAHAVNGATKPLASIMVGLTILGFMSGCALVYEGKYDYDQGWRMARVELLATPETMLKRWPKACGGASQANLDPSIQLAGVTFRVMQMPRWRTVVVPDSTFKVGDVVYLNINNCSMVHRTQWGFFQ